MAVLLNTSKGVSSSALLDFAHAMFDTSQPPRGSLGLMRVEAVGVSI